MGIKKHFIVVILLLTNLCVLSQNKNIFIGRNFWKTKPSIKEVEKKIKEGNNPTELNKYGFDAVTYAILENANTDVIKHLIEKKGNSVNKLTHDGRTYIFWAAYKNNMPIVKYLLKKGAKTDFVDDKGYSLFNFTAVGGVTNTNLYDLLIANGSNPKIEKTPFGANAILLIFPKIEDFKIIDYFTKKGLNAYSTDNNGNGAFNYAAKTGNKKILQTLIDRSFPYKNINKNGGNAMLFAARGSRKSYNTLDFFKFLEKLGVNLNITNNEGETPLHYIAYKNKDIETYNYFISKGVDPNKIDKNGNTALSISAFYNDIAIIKYLVYKTKNINNKNNKGKSALTHSLTNTPEVIKFLINNNADVKVIDKKGYNLAYYLFNLYQPDNKFFEKKLNILTSEGLNVEKPQKDGKNLYHIAVAKHSLPLVKLINEKYKKINLNSKNEKGYTPLQEAVMIGKNDLIIKKLISLGANTKVKTDFNESLYDLAKENEALRNIDINFLKN